MTGTVITGTVITGTVVPGSAVGRVTVTCTGASAIDAGAVGWAVGIKAELRAGGPG
jgi:hypothetical protein